MKAARIATLLSLTACLAACDHLQDDGRAVGNQVKSDSKQVASNVGDSVVATATVIRDNVKITGEKLHAWLIEPPPGKKPPQPVPSSYCYKTMQDILCYRQPMPNWEFRLVGYQGTDAIAPPPAIMQPLPMRDSDLSQLASNRVAGAHPVFVALPPDIKEISKDKGNSSEQPQDVSHEPLPDPAMAPQL